MPPLSWDPHRREVLRLIAAGAAASLAGCQKPDQPIYPAVADAEGDRAGRIRLYTTTLPLAGYGRGAVARVVDGRPIKLEGSPHHPGSLGATDLFNETAILDLFDPQRLRTPAGPIGVGGWDLLARAMLDSIGDRRGEGVVLLTGRVTSPTLLARIADARTRLPGLRHVRAEAFDDDRARAGAALAFGRALTMRPRFNDADVVLLLDADPLGPGPDQIAWGRAWADRRRAPGQQPSRTYVLEPSPTQSGRCADLRAPLHPGLVPDALLALAAALGAGSTPAPLPPIAERLVAAAARDMQAAHGRALVMIGPGQPAEAHALAAWINARLAAPVDWIAPVDPDPSGHVASLHGLASDMAAGRVRTLVVLDANPVLHAPPGWGMAEAIRRVPFSVSFASFPDETAMATTWRAPLAHPLEGWGDARWTDGTASLVQPMVKPLFGGRSAFAALDMIDPAGAQDSDHDRVQAQWRGRPGGDPRWWRDTLVSGVIADTAAALEPVGTPRLVLPRPGYVHTGPVLTLRPSPTLWDGVRATNAWAQECSDPITGEVWGAALRLSPADAARLNVERDDVVRLGPLTARVRVVEGQADGVATLPLGHGRAAGGPIAQHPGPDGFRLRAPDGGYAVTGLAIEPTGDRTYTPRGERLFGLDGEPDKLFPVVAPGHAAPPPAPGTTLLTDWPPEPKASPQWAMAIDANACIGCNACVVACQAENNVPPIGPEQVAMGRDMHWLRIDRYDHGGGSGYQPVPCMQCETAPCEPVCPVEAPVHSADGLNLQVYNRCVGTRTCEANCPYRVRRFNFLDYQGQGLQELFGELDDGPVTAQRNPDVTVRARGVMEKCTYCVHRIEAAKRDSDAFGTPLGPVTTACQDACPTRAITFGNLREEGAEVRRLRADPRHYALLGELGTRPRTTYLAKVRNAGESEA